jgi:hypothetical protein
MPCQGCERLKQERTEAKEAFDIARERLHACRGISSREKHRDLLQSVLASHDRLNSATAALNRHMLQHQHKETDQAGASDAEGENNGSDSGQPAA